MRSYSGLVNRRPFLFSSFYICFQDTCILKLRVAGDLFTNPVISASSRSPGPGPTCASVTCSTPRAPPQWPTSSPASRTDSAGPTSPCRRTSPCSECIWRNVAFLLSCLTYTRLWLYVVVDHWPWCFKNPFPIFILNTGVIFSCLACQ